MSIEIERVGSLYKASYRPPHGTGQPWDSPSAMSVDDLIGALLDRGCHQTDIGDAFFEADPEWLSRYRQKSGK